MFLVESFVRIGRADIHIRIGGSIIQVPIEQTSIRPIIPITTDTRRSQAQQDPMVRGRLFHIPLKPPLHGFMKRRREPIATNAVEGALARYQENKPAEDPVVQLPPTRGARNPVAW